MEILKNLYQKYLKDEENRKVSIFIISFTILVSLFYLLSGLGYFDKITFGLATLGVKSSEFILKTQVDGINFEGNTITFNHFRVNVNAGCDGLEIIILFIIAVLSFPVPYIKKIPAIILGSIILFLINLIRILALFYIGYNFNDKLDLFHNDIFPLMIIIFEFILWVIWIKWASKTKDKNL